MTKVQVKKLGGTYTWMLRAISDKSFNLQPAEKQLYSL